MSCRWESCFPAPGKNYVHALSKKNVKFSRRRGKLSRRREKITNIQYRSKICGVSRRWRKLFPGAGRLWSRVWRSSEARLKKECKFSRRREKLTPSAKKNVGRRRVNIQEKMCRFSRRRGKLCPSAGIAVFDFCKADVS